MNANRSLRIALVVAGVSSAGMGAYHFFLPHIWGWEGWLMGLPPMIHWGVHAINTFFSALLVAGGVLTLAMLHYGADAPIARGLLVAMTLCWEINAINQIVSPPPIPPRMLPLRVTLLGFSLLATLAYAFAAMTAYRRGVSRSG